MFALRRIPEGGCILADEVGPGKTIEAGLVVAQLLAEGATRVLIVVPRPLLGQWQHELYTLFGIEAVEAADAAIDVGGAGVFLAGRLVAHPYLPAAQIDGYRCPDHGPMRRPLNVWRQLGRHREVRVSEQLFGSQ